MSQSEIDARDAARWRAIKPFLAVDGDYDDSLRILITTEPNGRIGEPFVGTRDTSVDEAADRLASPSLGA